MPERLFRLFLRLLPSEFRADYGREMEATFRAEASGASGVGRLQLWAATLADIFRTAPSEHWDILVRDLRFAVRTMARSPLHTATAVVTLALGIGANVAMFAVIDTVLLAPLPYRQSDELVMVMEQQPGREPGNMGYLTFADVRARARALSSMAAATQSFATLTGDGLDPERVSAMRVSASYFEMIGVTPVIGRGFTEAEDRPGEARRVVILSDALWRRRFGADPSVIGRPVSVGSQTHVIVGIMPRRFDDLVAGRLYEGAEMWFPLGYDPAAAFACRTCRHLLVLGRLAPGQTTDSAAREMTAVMGGLAEEHPSQYHAPSIAVRKVSEFFLGPVRPVLLVLWAGVAMLLLVACANVANLQLLNAADRAHEVAVRVALGVTRARLGRQLMTEALLLSALGGIGGLALAAVCLRVVSVMGPSQLPRLERVAIEPTAVLVAIGITVASGLVFGLVPLRKVGRSAAGGELAGYGRRTDSGECLAEQGGAGRRQRGDGGDAARGIGAARPEHVGSARRRARVRPRPRADNGGGPWRSALLEWRSRRANRRRHVLLQSGARTRARPAGCGVRLGGQHAAARRRAGRVRPAHRGPPAREPRRGAGRGAVRGAGQLLRRAEGPGGEWPCVRCP